MISISDNLKQKLYTGAPKTLKLTFSDGTVITNESIKQGSFELEQTLCDEEQFTFGLCHAACFRVQVLYGERTTKFKGLTVNVDFGVDGESEVIRLGTFKVDDDELTDDRMYRDLVCYDVMKDILERDVTSWYAGLTESMPMSLQAFRNSFFSHVGVTQRSTSLPNDSVTIEKTVIAEGENAMSGQMVLKVICEMNGCSGVIDNQGQFRYVFFDLTPEVQVVENGAYITGSSLTPEGFHQGSFKFKDYTMSPMGGIQLRETDTDSGAVAGSTNNAYAITANFLTFGKGAAEKQSIVDNIFNQVKNFYYRPAQVEVRAMPWLEVGDSVEIVGDKVTSVVPILHRSMSGITAAYDVFTAKGSEYFTFNINSLTNRFESIRNKTLEIKQSVDEVTTIMTEKFEDIDGDMVTLQSTVTQTQTLISNEVTERINGETALRSEISQTANSFTTLVESRTSSAYIIGKINENGDSELKIHGDQVDIEGSVTFHNLIDDSVTQIIGGDIITETIYADEGIYGDLAVDELITTRRIQLYLKKDKSDDHYVHIHDASVELIRGWIDKSSGTDETWGLPPVQAKNTKEELLYWNYEPVFPLRGKVSHIEDGVTFTHERDDSLTIKGLATDDAYYYFYNFAESSTESTEAYSKFAGKTMTLGGCPDSASLNTYYLCCELDGTSYTDTGTGATITFPDNAPTSWKVYVKVANGYDANLSFKPTLTDAASTLEEIKGITFVNGYPYINGSKLLITTKQTPYPVMTYNYVDTKAASFSFDDATEDKVAVTLGNAEIAGRSNDNMGLTVTVPWKDDPESGQSVVSVDGTSGKIILNDSVHELTLWGNAVNIEEGYAKEAPLTWKQDNVLYPICPVIPISESDFDPTATYPSGFLIAVLEDAT